MGTFPLFKSKKPNITINVKILTSLQI